MYAFAHAIGNTSTAFYDLAKISFSITNCNTCLLYTSDAADERSSVDLGGRRIIKKKTHEEHTSARDKLSNITTHHIQARL